MSFEKINKHLIIEGMIKNLKETCRLNGREFPASHEELTRMMLLGEITYDEAQRRLDEMSGGKDEII